MKTLHQPKRVKKAESKGRILYFALGVLLFVIIVFAGQGMSEADGNGVDIQPNPRSSVSEDRLIGENAKIKTPDSEDEWSDSAGPDTMTEHDRQML